MGGPQGMMMGPGMGGMGPNGGMHPDMMAMNGMGMGGMGYHPGNPMSNNNMNQAAFNPAGVPVQHSPMNGNIGLAGGNMKLDAPDMAAQMMMAGQVPMQPGFSETGMDEGAQGSDAGGMPNSAMGSEFGQQVGCVHCVCGRPLIHPFIVGHATSHAAGLRWWIQRSGTRWSRCICSRSPWWCLRRSRPWR